MHMGERPFLGFQCPLRWEDLDVMGLTQLVFSVA